MLIKKYIFFFAIILLYITLTYLVYELIKYHLDYFLLIFFVITFVGNILILLIKNKFKLKIAIWLAINFGLVLITCFKTVIHGLTGYLSNYTWMDVLSDFINCVLVPNWTIPLIHRLWKEVLLQLKN